MLMTESIYWRIYYVLKIYPQIFFEEGFQPYQLIKPKWLIIFKTAAEGQGGCTTARALKRGKLFKEKNPATLKRF